MKLAQEESSRRFSAAFYDARQDGAAPPESQARTSALLEVDQLHHRGHREHRGEGLFGGTTEGTEDKERKEQALVLGLDVLRVFGAFRGDWLPAW